MPRVSQAYREARRAQILDAAIVCFSRQGFHRATMQDIVTQSKLSPGAIYNYFKSKEQIIRAIADERHAIERAFIAAAEQESTIAAAFQHIREAFFGRLKDPKEWRRRRVSIQLWVEAQRSPEIRKLVRRGIDQPRRLLSALIVKAQRRGEISRQIEADAAARLMIAAFHGFVLQLEWDERTPVDPYVKVLDLCLRRLLQTP